MRRVILVIPAAVCFRRLPTFWQLSTSAHFLWGRPAAAGPGSCWRRWPAWRRCCPARISSRSWTWTRCSGESTGHKKRGAAFGHTEISGKTVLVRGLNMLAATISTPQAAPVIAGTRLRGGSANSARGAAAFAAEAISAARAAGCTGTIVARADSRFYGAASTGACRRVGARFSVTARMAPAVKAAIAFIPEDAGHHRPADRPSGPRPEPQSRRGAGRAVPGMALPPRSSCYRPRATTATMPWWSRCSRTGPTAPWLICHQLSFAANAAWHPPGPDRRGCPHRPPWPRRGQAVRAHQSRARPGPRSWNSAVTCAPSTHPRSGSRSSATTSGRT